MDICAEKETVREGGEETKNPETFTGKRLWTG
jgi:hypothetical protein